MMPSTDFSSSLSAQASRDTYGFGPVAVPPGGFFYQSGLYSSGGSEARRPKHRINPANLSIVKDEGQGYDVTFRYGHVYCGLQYVQVDGDARVRDGDVWLNISVNGGNFKASIGTSDDGDLSVLLYTVNVNTIDDYVSNMLFIPYYN